MTHGSNLFFFIEAMTSSKIKYTWGIVYCKETNQILLLNREKHPWMGRWNGVGGKLDQDEDQLTCIIRETWEETGLHLPQYEPRGVMTWSADGEDLGGMYLFTAAVTREDVERYPTPKKYCHEGILDWKNLDWVMHPDNSGVVDNVKVMLSDLFEASERSLFATKYLDGKLAGVDYMPIGH